MATVRTNPLINGLSGMLGNTIVFKTLRGKTIMANRPAPPKKESQQQKTNRSKFRDASHWAHQVLLDPARKEYYQKKAKKLKLPNAYTAAITDYMRNARLDKGITIGNEVTYGVVKKDFELNKVEVVIKGTTGEVKEVRLVTKDKHNEWNFHVSKEELFAGVTVAITNVSRKTTWVDLNS